MSKKAGDIEIPLTHAQIGALNAAAERMAMRLFDMISAIREVEAGASAASRVAAVPSARSAVAEAEAELAVFRIAAVNVLLEVQEAYPFDAVAILKKTTRNYPRALQEQREKLDALEGALALVTGPVGQG
jgi:hypothetical protein